MPDSSIYDVIVLGAGIAGLSAAKILSKEGLRTVVLEARNRNGGRIHTIRISSASEEDGTDAVIDLGASYLHGCDNSQYLQPLFTLANRLKMPTVTAPGDVLGPHRGWECPEIAIWRDQETGEEIDLADVADMSFLIDRCLVHILITHMNSSNTKANLSEALNSSLDACLRLLFKAGQRTSPTLSPRERGIFDTLFSRYIAYVNPTSRLPARMSLGPYYEADASANLAFDTTQPTLESKIAYVDWLEKKRWHLKHYPSKPSVVRRVEHKWEDRLVLGGFDKMIDFLANGLDIHHQTVVRRIDWTDVQSSKSCKSQSGKKENLICIETNSCLETESYSRQPPKKYYTRYCIVTVPVGVLKGLDRRSAIKFLPPLPTHKQSAIDRLAIPKSGAETHNKVVLKFRPSDVFWDRTSPQLICPGARLHLLNCDYFGQSGVLVAHIWGGSKLRLFNKPDHSVVKDLLSILSGMYPHQKPLPEPEFTTVTRWSEDPFSLGAYTAGEVESGDADRHAYANSLPSEAHPRLLFAGEGTVDSSGGQQCTHGAFSSGIAKAFDVLDHMHGTRTRLRDVRIIDYLTGSRIYNHAPHGMLRRAMKRTHSELTPRIDNLFPVVRCKSATKSERSSVCQEPEDSVENQEQSPSDFDYLPSNRRRSVRFTTWISSQASASLYTDYKSREQSHFHNSTASSSSVTSVGSLRDDFTPSPSPSATDGEAGDTRIGSKLHTKPALLAQHQPPLLVFEVPTTMHGISSR